MRKSVTYLSLLLAPAGLAFVALPGCGTEPSATPQTQNLSDESHTVIAEMQRTDPGLKDFLQSSYAYAVFPDVGKGAVVVGGTYGRGEVFEQNKFIGYADMSAATVGASLGGETYSEIIVFQDKNALDVMTNNKMAFDATASAIVLKEGAAGSTKYINGVAVFKNAKGGLMVDASIGGQQFTFRAAQVENE
jgi:lipid-binding SYLF domain-containing protein